MGFFFGTRTKSDIDREIASFQGQLEREKASLASAKESTRLFKSRGDKSYHADTSNPTRRIASIKSQIATLKAERKNAPK